MGAPGRVSFGKGTEVGLAGCNLSTPPMEDVYDLKLVALEGREEAVVKGLEWALEGREEVGAGLWWWAAAPARW